MMRGAIISGALLVANSASLANGYVTSFVDLHFRDAHGAERDVRSAWAIDIPELASGKPDCTGNLGGMLPTLEREVRRKRPESAEMTLTGVTCEPVRRSWVKIVQRVPVTNAAANEE
jgi:hypothetical protein